jgi:hypothetical protein
MRLGRLGLAFLTIFIVAAVAVPFSETMGNAPTNTCTSVASSFFSVPAVYGQGQVPVGNPVSLDLTSYFGLTNTIIPYNVVNLQPFANTLVTFQLPAGSQWLYASVVWNGNGATAYVFNSPNSYSLFSHSVFKGEYQSVSSTTVPGTSTAPGYVVTTTFDVKMYATPLPGGYIDPTVTGSQSVQFNALVGEVGYVIAQGTFNYVLKGKVTGVSAQNSATYAYRGYGVCSQSAKAGGANTTIGYVQEDGYANFCLSVASDWWAGWPGMALNSLTGQLTYNASPYWNTGVTLGCRCNGFSFPSPP